jgi:TM2 domain-containing membrane protein YozV
MDQNKIDMFISTMSGKFPSEKIMLIKSQLEKMDDSRFTMVQSAEYKDPTTLLIISIFLGNLGVDRFMLGQTGAGIGKLLTCGGMGIWTLIDWFTVQKNTKEVNYQKFMQLAA